jgi:hypothetical protein
MASLQKRRILIGVVSVIGLLGLAVGSPVLYEVAVIHHTINGFRLDEAVYVQDAKHGISPQDFFNPPYLKKYGLDLAAAVDKKGNFAPDGVQWMRWGTETKTAAVLMWREHDRLGAWEIWSLNHCIDHYYAQNGDAQRVVDVLNACMSFHHDPAGH